MDDVSLEDDLFYTINLGIQGEYPWNFFEFEKTAIWSADLLSIPIDDWNLNQKNIVIERNNKSVEIVLNKFDHFHQLAGFMFSEFGDEIFRKQFVRFFIIHKFIKRYRETLKGKDLAVRKDDYNAIKNSLYWALCLLPFTKKVYTMNGIEYDFIYNDVIRLGKSISSELEM